MGGNRSGNGVHRVLEGLAGFGRERGGEDLVLRRVGGSRSDAFGGAGGCGAGCNLCGGSGGLRAGGKDGQAGQGGDEEKAAPDRGRCLHEVEFGG
jgi:hypothetical protein